MISTLKEESTDSFESLGFQAGSILLLAA